MGSLTVLLQKVIYKSSQNRGEDHSNSIILNKHIFIKLIQSVSEEQLKRILVDNEMGPVSLDGEDLSLWLEAMRRVLGLNQTEMGHLVDASQSEISKLETNSEKASFSRERITGIVEKILQQIRTLNNRAA